MGLSLRQLLCSIAAIGAAVGVYYALRGALGQETVSWVCILAAAPIAAAGFFEYDGLNFEKFLATVIENEMRCAGPRIWKVENAYEQPKTSKLHQKEDEARNKHKAKSKRKPKKEAQTFEIE